MTKKERVKFKELKKQNAELLMYIRLFCYECFGFFRDGYQKCVSPNCPLFPYFPTKGQLKKKNFIERAKKLEKSLGN